MSVVSYNVMSCRSNVMPSEYTSLNVRTPKIVEFLCRHLHFGSIVCLQDVDQCIMNELDAILKEYNYSYYHERDGTMIAFPNGGYLCKGVSSVRLGSLIKDSKGPAALASQSRNVLLGVELTHLRTGKSLTVYNYNMSLCKMCAPARTYLVTKLVDLCVGERVIICVDLKELPGKYNHRLVTSRFYDPRIPGNRHNITTYSISEDGRVTRGCLDYIFCSRNVRACKTIQPRIDEPIPSTRHGSDHVPLVLLFELR